MGTFSFSEMRRPEITDKPELTRAIFALEPCSCEMNFLNLFAWADDYETVFSFAGEFPCFYFKKIDWLLFPGGLAKAPAPEEIYRISEELRANGASGRISHVPEKYVKEYPELSRWFRVEQAPVDHGEYIYSIDKLIGLHGSKLAKKKNLIHQFQKLYPDYRVVPLSRENLADCAELSKEWAVHHGETDTVYEEETALRRTWQYASELDVRGICIFVGERLAAYSLSTRINETTFDEHYEKTDPEFKGAAQIINYETAFALRNECTFLNREQDLGLEGLRHAKMSYVPEEILRTWNLYPKTVKD